MEVMALDLEPFRWNWGTITAGDTYPAENWLESNSDNTTALSRVRIKIKDSAGSTFATLDSSSSGITINAATAGAWDWTVNALTAPTSAGIYNYDMETTDSVGVISTESTGQWEILTQETD
jgi:hypothetical protein|tara:strand:+ start:626 stop:988 length:363 start_codon:yes stop_codon:yes gene_type:complete